MSLQNKEVGGQSDSKAGSKYTCRAQSLSIFSLCHPESFSEHQQE